MEDMERIEGDGRGIYSKIRLDLCWLDHLTREHSQNRKRHQERKQMQHHDLET